MMMLIEIIEIFFFIFFRNQLVKLHQKAQILRAKERAQRKEKGAQRGREKGNEANITSYLMTCPLFVVLLYNRGPE